ncbi:MAG TPA: MaoC family dehydratase N-terminal domain-containing protein, partial [Candidatus Hydrogenedentes bacterium]|nr:MaoC family dehydratase N-terminal domain-containing protein [Candidatus Hydrogenedentota bacterium]
MEVNSTYAGSVSKPLETEITWRHAMNYAASIGDHNPWYFDDERDGGIIAPPMLVVALTWPFGASARHYW